MNSVFSILISVTFLFLRCSSAERLSENKALYESINPERPFSDSRFEEINGIKIHYRYGLKKGDAYRAKILMIHGLAGSTYSFRHTAEFLNKNRILAVSVDLPAFGYSSRKLGLNHSSYDRALMISELMKRIDASLPKKTALLKWNLLGHSMGGRTVLSMALGKDISERIQSLTLIAPAAYFKGSKFGKFLLRASLIRSAAETVMSENYLNRKSFDKLLESAYARKPEPEETAGYLTPLLSPNSEKAFFDAPINSDESSAASDFSKIKHPVLILHGKKDSWVPPEESEKLSQEIQGSTLTVIEDSGHCPMETHPDTVNKLILSFINNSSLPKIN